MQVDEEITPRKAQRPGPRSLNRNSSFGWPKGTVRAIITLVLIVITAIQGFNLIFSAKIMTPEQLKTAYSVFTAFMSATSLMIGSYISKK